jgi:NADH:ubiquinone oxidoreductase subunit K
LIRIEHVLVVSALLFSIGLFIALSRRSAVGVLMGIELMLNSVNLTLIGFSRFIDTPNGGRAIDGQVFAVFVITVAAAEAAVALALAVSVYRLRRSIDVDKLNILKW